MLKGLNDFLDKHEGREVGSSTKAILKERKHQGYDGGHKAKALKEAKGIRYTLHRMDTGTFGDLGYKKVGTYHSKPGETKETIKKMWDEHGKHKYTFHKK